MRRRHPIERRSTPGHEGYVEKMTTGTGVRGGRSYTPRCLCGWAGEDRDRYGRDQAVADLENHVEAAR